MFIGRILRAAGNDGVTININTENDPENKLGMRTARAAYEAMLAVGFEAKIKDKDGKEIPNIKIMLNGKPIDLDKLYYESNKNKEYHAKHQQIRANTYQSIKQVQGDIKEQMNAYRRTLGTTAPPAPPAGATSSSPPSAAATTPSPATAPGAATSRAAGAITPPPATARSTGTISGGPTR
jgi:hypothetical protein